MTKSYVGMGAEMCPVCGCSHSEVVLLDRRLHETFESGIHLVGMSLCPEHEAMRAEYVALVEISEPPTKSTLAHEIKRTGRIAHVRRTAAAQIFDADLSTTALAHVEVGVIDKIEAMTKMSPDTPTT